MGLLELPGELLDEIILLTLPDGFMSLALSCKAIYERATAQIPRHNKGRRLWRYAYRPSNDPGKALQLLFEISRDPLTAQYLDVLNLRDPLGDGSQYDYSQISDEFRMEDDSMAKIKALVTNTEWFEQAGVDVEDWWSKMMQEDETEDEDDAGNGLPYAVVALLGQLPNLKSLQLPDTWKNVSISDDATQDQNQLGYAVDELVTYSNKNIHSGTPLKELSTLLPFMPAGYEARAGLQCVEPLLTLSHMKELYGVSLLAVDDEYTGIPFTWRSKLDSSLRRIELAYCCINCEGISALLKHTPLLQVFRYSHQTKWHGCQHDWNPGQFVNALSEHCATTITEAAITIDELHGEIVNGASTFLSLVKLRSLECDAGVFCGPPLESGQRKGQNACVPPGDMPWTEHDIPCIGSMLPSSIENVVINTSFPVDDEQALRALLKNVRQQKAERLPKLSAVLIRQYNGDSANEVFGIPGVVVCVNGSEGETELLPRPMLPTWKRDFATRTGGIAYI